MIFCQSLFKDTIVTLFIAKKPHNTNHKLFYPTYRKVSNPKNILL